jgi:two-component system response regulator HydG
VAKTFTSAALQRLKAHDWPGNVRELRNVVERAFILADEQMGVESLPLTAEGVGKAVGVRVGTSLSDAERMLIVATLGECRGDRAKTAEVLGLSRKLLDSRLKEYAAAES